MNALISEIKCLFSQASFVKIILHANPAWILIITVFFTCPKFSVLLGDSFSVSLKIRSLTLRGRGNKCFGKKKNIYTHLFSKSSSEFVFKFND